MTDYILHITKCLELADKELSKADPEIFDMEGLSGNKTRHFYNNICSMEDARYLEVGT